MVSKLSKCSSTSNRRGRSLPDHNTMKTMSVLNVFTQAETRATAHEELHLILSIILYIYTYCNSSGNKIITDLDIPTNLLHSPRGHDPATPCNDFHSICKREREKGIRFPLKGAEVSRDFEILMYHCLQKGTKQ